MDELLRFDFNRRYVSFDFETCDLNLVNTKPWQASWITYKGKIETSRNDRYLWFDDLNVSADAARITRFDYYNYKSRAEDPKQVLDDILKVFNDPSYTIVGQNLLGFDVYVMNVLRKLCGYKPDNSYINRIIDTRALAMAIGSGQKDFDKKDILAQYRLINHRDKKIKASQGALLKQYGIPHDPATLHNSIVDVEMTFKIFQKQIFDLNI